VLVFASAIAVAVVRAAVGKKRSWLAAGGFGLLAGALTALAIFVATIAFGLSINCYS